MGKLLKIENLLTYWRVYRSTELPKKPHGIEPIITDTIEALQEYRDFLKEKGLEQGKEFKHGPEKIRDQQVR